MPEALTTAEIQQICNIINHFGEEGPRACVQNFMYFKPKYIEECIEKAIGALSKLKKQVKHG
jgi:hypothetical protein